jgi:hypothetical protein
VGASRQIFPPASQTTTRPTHRPPAGRQKKNENETQISENKSYPMLNKLKSSSKTKLNLMMSAAFQRQTLPHHTNMKKKAIKVTLSG